MSQSTPLLSQTSSDKQRLLGALMAAMRESELSSDQLLPAIVKSYDRAKNVATVQPLIQWVDVNDGLHDRNAFASINVLSLGGGGFHINFPLMAGDLGWIIAADRDISLFKQSLANAKPNSGRIHKFEDGWFVPDVFRKYTVNSSAASTNQMVIESLDGTTCIAIGEGIVNITAPTSVTITTPQATFTGNVTIDQNLQVNQDITVSQNLSVTQNATVTGATAVNGGFTASSGAACTLPANATVGGTTVSTHGHTSSSPGTRTSGGMIP